jgi:hypothetical protein
MFKLLRSCRIRGNLIPSRSNVPCPSHQASAWFARGRLGAKGELSLGEAESVAKLVELFVRSLEAGEFERRIRGLEETAGVRYVGRARTANAA